MSLLVDKSESPNPELQDRIREGNLKVFSVLAANYNRLHQEIFNLVEQKRLDQTLSKVENEIVANNSKALDFGCGTGNVTRLLLGHGFEVTAIDISPDMLSILSRRLSSYIKARRLTIALADDPDTVGGEYSLIALYSVLHHLPDPIQYMASLARHVKIGGVLMVDHESKRPNPRRLYALYRASNSFLRRAAVFPHKSPSHNFALSDFWEDKIPWKRIDQNMENAGFKVLGFEYLSHRTIVPNPLYFLMRAIATDTILRVYLRRQ